MFGNFVGLNSLSLWVDQKERPQLVTQQQYNFSRNITWVKGTYITWIGICFLSTASSPSSALKSLTPKALKRGKHKQQDAQQNDTLRNRRSLPGSRSIKEVVKDGVPRYVKADDVKRISQADKETQQKEEGEKTSSYTTTMECKIIICMSL